jgi:biopolymer transport protein ExbD
MAEKRRFLDVWIVETNQVYTEVPFMVVSDWVQQSRLLANDMLRPSGTKEWHLLGESADFKPYLPRPEPQRVDDAAEALEAVELDFTWKKRHSEEDDDVDMIPLIDVSLVLLIFFMLTATGAGAMSSIPAPLIDHGGVTSADVTVGIDLRGEPGNETEVYSLDVSDKSAARDGDRSLGTKDALLARLDEVLRTSSVGVELTIHPNERVKSGVFRQFLVDLQQEPRRSKIRRINTGGREKPR